MLIQSVKRAVPMKYDLLAGTGISLVDENNLIIGYLVLCGPITHKIPGNAEISQNIVANISNIINAALSDA